MSQYTDISTSMEGVLLGTATGDSVGLPAENLKPAKIEAFGWRNNWRQRLFFGKGMISDDTEHTLFTAQAILKYPNDPDKFQACLGRKLKWWLASLPAGTGQATAKAIFKMWFFIPWKKCGVFSAGNGPAMRAAIIGVAIKDFEMMKQYLKASTELTHSDPKAYLGSLAVALLARHLSEKKTLTIAEAKELLNLEDPEWQKLMKELFEYLEEGKSLDEYRKHLCGAKGLTGYIYHTVPGVIYGILSNKLNFEKSLADIMNQGGDTDSTAAIAGSILGAMGRECKIPSIWIDNLMEQPRSIKLLRKVANNLDQETNKQIPYFVPFIFLRNLFFLTIVLSHGFLRLLPSSIIKKLTG